VVPAGAERAEWRGAATPRPATLSAEDDLLLARIARAIARRGLVTPAVLWLEGLRPLSYLGSQALYFCEPLLQALVPSLALGRLAAILEERAHLERLIRHIEAAAADPAATAPPGPSAPVAAVSGASGAAPGPASGPAAPAGEAP